ncbi:MAG: hypothetical protein WB502_01175 [Thermoactinomyces sp.]
MSKKYIQMAILLGLFFLPCTGCQGFSFDLNSEAVKEETDLNRKLFDQVPAVKDLLLDARVQAYLKQQPYIYGQSVDERILAVLSHEEPGQSYRLDFYQLLAGEHIQTLYLPSQSELEARMHSQNGDEILEYISIVQEAIDHGYRIRKPVKPILLNPQTRYILSKEKGWYARLVREDNHLNLIVENRHKERWTLFRQDLRKTENGRVFACLLPFSENDPGWTFAILIMGEKAEANVVRHLNENILSALPFDQELEQACNRILAEGKADCRLVFRHDQPDSWYLLLEGMQEESAGSRVSYQGRAEQFLILNNNREVLIKGTGQNLVHAGQSFRFPGQVHSYRLHISKSGQEPEKLLAVDVLDAKQQVMETFVWCWNDQQRQFQRVEGN